MKIRALLFTACLLAGVSQSATAQTLKESSYEVRFQLDLHVPEAALASYLPEKWTTTGGAQGTNLRAIFIDRITVFGPDGKPVGKGTSRLVTLVAPVRDPSGASVQMVIGGLTDDPADAPGPFGNYLLATTHSMQRSTTGSGPGTLDSQDWVFRAESGERMELHVKYERGAGEGKQTEIKFYSSKNPEIYQISRQEQSLDKTRLANSNLPDRVREFSFEAAGGRFAKLFETKVPVLSWDNLLWLTRTVYVP